MTIPSSKTNTIYLIYDGDCILCNRCAQALRIKKSVGELQIMNARVSCPLVDEVRNSGYDLNEGIIVKYHNTFYHGANAVHLLALLGSPVDPFNKLNALLFKSRILSSFFYPLFKFIRKLLLWMRRTPQIKNTTTKRFLYQNIFKDTHEKLPKIFRSRYANRVFTNDIVTVSGTISISCSKIFSLLSPLFRIVGAFVPYPGTDVPIIVRFVSNENSEKITINRTFYFSNRKPYTFNSYLLPLQNGSVVEFIKYGLGWRASMQRNESQIKMVHRGYVIKIFNQLIPLPLSLIMGNCYAEEIAVSDTSFEMLMKLTHPLFGKLFQYQGKFTLEDPLCFEKC